MTDRIPRARLNLATAVAAALLARPSVAHVPGLTEGLTYLGPAVFVLLLLWLGNYPGEKVLLALIRLDRARPPGTIRRGRRWVHTRMPRGGGLLASALAARAPPVSARLR
jgi:hypothetical protein